MKSCWCERDTAIMTDKIKNFIPLNGSRLPGISWSVLWSPWQHWAPLVLLPGGRSRNHSHNGRGCPVIVCWIVWHGFSQFRMSIDLKLYCFTIISNYKGFIYRYMLYMLSCVASGRLNLPRCLRCHLSDGDTSVYICTDKISYD